MRVEFKVSQEGSDWVVRRGSAIVLRSKSKEAALTAAKNLAREAARKENAVVKAQAKTGDWSEVAAYRREPTFFL